MVVALLILFFRLPSVALDVFFGVALLATLVIVASMHMFPKDYLINREGPVVLLTGVLFPLDFVGTLILISGPLFS